MGRGDVPRLLPFGCVLHVLAGSLHHLARFAHCLVDLAASFLGRTVGWLSIHGLGEALESLHVPALRLVHRAPRERAEELVEKPLEAQS